MPDRKVKKIFPFISLPVLLISFLAIWYFVFLPPVRDLKIVFCDVGQGDGTLLEFPDGKTALVDSGPDIKILECLGKNLPFYRRKIDLVFLSHPDADHVGGLNYVLNHYKVGRIIESGIGKNTKAYQSFADTVKAQQIPEIIALQGTEFDITSKTKAKVLLPASVSGSTSLNNMSEILLLTYIKEEILFTGDMEKEEATQMASFYPKLQANLIKIPHHGSKYSLDERFYYQLAPKYAIISVGVKNRYGHPHKEVLDFLGKRGIEIFRTDQLGDITFETNGATMKWIKSN